MLKLCNRGIPKVCLNGINFTYYETHGPQAQEEGDVAQLLQHWNDVGVPVGFSILYAENKEGTYGSPRLNTGMWFSVSTGSVLIYQLALTEAIFEISENLDEPRINLCILNTFLIFQSKTPKAQSTVLRYRHATLPQKSQSTVLRYRHATLPQKSQSTVLRYRHATLPQKSQSTMLRYQHATLPQKSQSTVLIYQHATLP